MAWFPSEEEALAFAGLAALVRWTGLSPQALAAVEAGTGPLQDSSRNLSLLPSQVVRAAIQAARTPSMEEGEPDLPLTPVEASQMGLAWRIARRIAITSSGSAWANAIDVDPLGPTSGTGPATLGLPQGAQGGGGATAQTPR